jgi:recombination protein RecA
MLGVGGLPSGRVIEIAGGEGGGKTTLSLVCAAAVRQAGMEVVFIDAEYSFDEEMANRIGATGLLVHQPDYGEQGLELARQMLPVKAVGLIIVDSTAGLVPKAHLEAVYSTDIVAGNSQMLSLKTRQICVDLQPDGPTVILINQLRDAFGVSFGEKTSTPGGRTLKHMAHIRMAVSRKKLIDQGKVPVGHWMNTKYLKSKMTSPARMVDIPILWGAGIDPQLDLLEMAAMNGLLTKNETTGNYNRVVGGKPQPIKWSEEFKAELETALGGGTEAPIKPKTPFKRSKK